MPHLGPIALEALDELPWVTQCRRVPALDLVGDDAEALPHDATQPRRREEPVAATEQVPRWNVRPGAQRPRLLARRL